MTSRRPNGPSASAAVPDRFARRRWWARLHRWRWSLLLGALLTLGTLATWVVLTSTLLGVREVEVTGVGASRVAQVDLLEVRAVVGVADGTPLARVDLDEAASRVERLPGVASATVTRDWPRGLHVDVVERQPVAALEVDGRWRAMDATGAVFGSYEQPPQAMPQVLADVEPAEQRSALSEAGSVLASLEPSIAARLDSIEVASRDDILLVLGSGERVRWGSAEDSARKAEVLMVLLRIPAAVYDVTVPELPTTSQTVQEEPSATPTPTPAADPTETPTPMPPADPSATPTSMPPAGPRPSG